MDLLPKFQAGILNGWIPLIIYFIGLIVSASLYSREARAWLFNNPQDENMGVFKFIRLFGQFAMVATILMMVFTPMRIGNPVFLAGATVYLVGFVLEMSALYYFRKAPAGQPVNHGPYRFSRNPQWVGLFLVLLGSAIAVGVWLYIMVVVLVGIIYHKQILDEEKACIKKYGESYREYMERNPRYFLFL
jgi:protein-S-isoprenylcysteine O-methyltransferase Ste14